MKSHRDLDVWKVSMELVTEVYSCTKHFPREEQYGLTSQLRRAVISVVSNIAEGAARQGKKEFIHFLYCSLGSAAEIEAQLECAKRLSYVSEVDVEAATDLRERVAQLLYGLIKKLKQ